MLLCCADVCVDIQPDHEGNSPSAGAAFVQGGRLKGVPGSIGSGAPGSPGDGTYCERLSGKQSLSDGPQTLMFYKQVRRVMSCRGNAC